MHIFSADILSQIPPRVVVSMLVDSILGGKDGEPSSDILNMFREGLIERSRYFFLSGPEDIIQDDRNTLIRAAKMAVHESLDPSDGFSSDFSELLELTGECYADLARNDGNLFLED